MWKYYGSTSRFHPQFMTGTLSLLSCQILWQIHGFLCTALKQKLWECFHVLTGHHTYPFKHLIRHRQSLCFSKLMKHFISFFRNLNSLTAPYYVIGVKSNWAPQVWNTRLWSDCDRSVTTAPPTPSSFSVYQSAKPGCFFLPSVGMFIPPTASQVWAAGWIHGCYRDSEAPGTVPWSLDRGVGLLLCFFALSFNSHGLNKNYFEEFCEFWSISKKWSKSSHRGLSQTAVWAVMTVLQDQFSIIYLSLKSEKTLLQARRTEGCPRIF